jgi:hypothetical protein
LRKQFIPSSISKEKRSDNYVLRTPRHQLIKYGRSQDKQKDVDEMRGLHHCKFIKNGMLTRVRKITKNNNIKEVYDLTVEGQSNYLTSSFLVHNSGYASVMLRCLDITYGVDPLEYGLIWERFLGFDDLHFIKESDFGFDEDVKVVEIDELDIDRDLEDDQGGVDRY